MSLYYTPEHAKVGDVIPFFDRRSGRFENFYLKNWNPDAPREQVVHGWHRMSGAWPDRITETPVHILGGTGSVVEVDGTYHLFYCTFDDDPQRQWVRHATSGDLTHWHEVGEAFGPDPSIYEPSDWRDPFVFWNEDERCWWMLVAARRRACSGRNGCVGLCVSDDLLHWRAEGPVYAPDIHPAAYECPDMFRMGDWWYLVFSNYTDGFATYYRMSRSPRGPWVRPRSTPSIPARSMRRKPAATATAATCSDGLRPVGRTHGVSIRPRSMVRITGRGTGADPWWCTAWYSMPTARWVPRPRGCDRASGLRADAAGPPLPGSGAVAR